VPKAPTSQIQSYLNRRRRGGLTAATCNRYLAALKTLYKSAKIWGYVETRPTDDLTMLKEQSRVPPALLDKLLAQCSKSTWTVVVLAAGRYRNAPIRVGASESGRTSISTQRPSRSL